MKKVTVRFISNDCDTGRFEGVEVDKTGQGDEADDVAFLWMAAQIVERSRDEYEEKLDDLRESGESIEGVEDFDECEEFAKASETLWGDGDYYENARKLGLLIPESVSQIGDYDYDFEISY